MYLDSLLLLHVSLLFVKISNGGREEVLILLVVTVNGNRLMRNKKNNIRDSNVVPHRSTNLTRGCLTSLSGREAVLSSWYGRSCHCGVSAKIILLLQDSGLLPETVFALITEVY